MSHADRPFHILALHAHPDDIEFQCAGVLLLLARRGHRITMATMTPGDCGSAELGPDQISTIRRQEARRSAALAGAEYHCLEFRDLAITHDNPSRQRVTEFLRRIRPDLILTAPPADYLADHEITSRLVRDASFNAPIPNYATGVADPAPPTDRIAHLYYVDAIEGLDEFGARQPAGFCVDVTGVFAAKQQMLACHASQRDWLLRQHGLDAYLDSQARWGRERGTEIGVEYAEAFRQHLGHPYPRNNLLLELLGDGVGGNNEEP